MCDHGEEQKMSLSDYEADVLARLEDHLLDEDPDLAMQFLVLQHPSLDGFADSYELSWKSRAVGRLGVLLLALSTPGLLFGAWSLVVALLTIGAAVGTCALVGSWVADRRDHRYFSGLAANSGLHPSSGVSLRDPSDLN
jgi:Protein of unknown function (DUF3040)